MLQLTVPPEHLRPEKSTDESSFCTVAYNRVLKKLLKNIYARDNLCLKIFKKESSRLDAKTFNWGGSPLWECTLIQNLFASHGMAPRVVDVVQVGDRLAQVTTFLPPGRQPSAERAEKLKLLVKQYDLKTWRNYWDVNKRNWRSNLFVDFSGFYFNDLAGYELDLATAAHTRRGEYIGVAYQPVPELGIRGTREMTSRIKAMHLDEIDFNGKTVLDIGCNLGYLCRWASARGASRVVGVDRIAGLTRQIANVLGDWRSDYLAARLPEEVGEISLQSGIERFDIVIATAVVKHVGGLAPWLVGLCKDILIFEGHGSIAADVYEPQLREYFKNVEYQGETDDNYKRHLFRCRV